MSLATWIYKSLQFTRRQIDHSVCMFVISQHWINHIVCTAYHAPLPNPLNEQVQQLCVVLTMEVEIFQYIMWSVMDLRIHWLLATGIFIGIAVITMTMLLLPVIQVK